MYYHQAMQQDYDAEFAKAVVEEVDGHTKNNHWTLVKLSFVPKGIGVVPYVWYMQSKRNLTTGKITKYKARLNINGGKQEFGVNYYERYYPTSYMDGHPDTHHIQYRIC